MEVTDLSAVDVSTDYFTRKQLQGCMRSRFKVRIMQSDHNESFKMPNLDDFRSSGIQVLIEMSM